MCTDLGLVKRGRGGRIYFYYGGNVDFQVQIPEKILLISVNTR